MFNVIRKFKFSHGRFSCATSFTSATNFSLLEFNHFSSSAANALETNSKDSNPEPFSAVYLKKEYGVSPKKALIYSKFLTFDSLEKPLSVVTFLKAHHFTESQISRAVQKWPLILRCVPESSILPKIEFFRDLGFSSSEIVKILTLQPNLLVRNLEGQMIPCVDFLRSFLDSDKDVVFSILRYPGIFRENLHNTLLPNVEILREVGVPDSHIAALLRAAPRRIAVDPVSFRATVEEVLKLGLSPLTKGFIAGLIVMRQLSSSSWKEKIEYYKRWGWSEQQVRDAIRKSPRIMSISKDKIAKILDFLINRMACDISVLTFRPGLMMLSFEETIAPRRVVSLDVYASHFSNIDPVAQYKRWTTIQESNCSKNSENIIPHGYSQKVKAAFVVSDPVDWGRDIQVLCDILTSGGIPGEKNWHQPPLYFAADDLQYQAAFPSERLGMGAFRISLESVFNRIHDKPLEFTCFGKPNPSVFRNAETILGHLLQTSCPANVRTGNDLGSPSFKTLYMIGDNPLVDIKGAQQAGYPWFSILTRTGVFRQRENHTQYPADLVVDTVEDAVEFVLKREDAS